MQQVDITCFWCSKAMESDDETATVLWPAKLMGAEAPDGYVLCKACMDLFEARHTEPKSEQPEPGSGS